jgi:hypothetical protein
VSTEPTWKVYLPEWLAVYTAGAFGISGEAECKYVFDRRFAGRVREEDWRLEAGSVTSRLELRLPNLHGEFKHYSDAVGLASELVDDRGGVAHVVQRGSPEEKALLEYGKKKLPDASQEG